MITRQLRMLDTYQREQLIQADSLEVDDLSYIVDEGWIVITKMGAVWKPDGDSVHSYNKFLDDTRTGSSDIYAISPDMIVDLVVKYIGRRTDD